MAQTKLVNHVDAVFGGRSVRFQLHRDRTTVDRLEEAVGSVSACWGRFRDASWTMRDVRSVLALAHPGEKRPLDRPVITGEALATAERLSGKSVPRTTEKRGADLSVIDTVIATRPLAMYAPLAMQVLTAALFGLPEDGATFEEPPVREAA